MTAIKVAAAAGAGLAAALAVAAGAAIALLAAAITREGYDDDAPDPVKMSAYMEQLRAQGRETRWVR